MTARTSMLHVRVDGELKEKASLALGAMGLSVSDAVRLFLHRIVAEQAIPFEIKVPNAETRAAMAEADEIASQGTSRLKGTDELFAELEEVGRR